MVIETHELVHQLKKSTRFHNLFDLLTASVEASPADGLHLEFGYASGQTARHIAQCSPGKTLYSFDSFEGLPEDWSGEQERACECFHKQLHSPANFRQSRLDIRPPYRVHYFQ